MISSPVLVGVRLHRVLHRHRRHRARRHGRTQKLFVSAFSAMLVLLLVGTLVIGLNGLKGPEVSGLCHRSVTVIPARSPKKKMRLVPQFHHLPVIVSIWAFKPAA